MPLLDIPSAQPAFQNHLFSVRSQKLYHSNDKSFSYLWRSFKIPEKEKGFNVEKINIRRGELLINAVATLESKCSIESNGHDNQHKFHLDVNSERSLVVEHQHSNEESTELDEREKLRRLRISKANKGNTPWNKGRKHTPETLRRIRERTRLAMQDPKVKMKLVNLGHAQSNETRIKIGVGVRIGWNKRRKKLMLQETCHLEWQNLIADASRRGLVGEEELQWNSYEILDEQLEKEWLESVELRKKTPRPKSNQRAPKSAEQRKKISEAIAAKWADPAYRDRVYSGLSKYHGTTVGPDNPRRRPTSDRQHRKTSPTKKRADGMDNSAESKTKTQNPRTKLKRSKLPIYKDPLASSKLEMIKSIRAERENKKTEAITRAKLLIAEAEEAAKALEVAATRSPLARASLLETRKLIAEAIESIESIESYYGENGQYNLSTDAVNNVEKVEMNSEGLILKDQINGARALETNNDIPDFDFDKLTLQKILNQDEDEELVPTKSSYHVDLSKLEAGYRREPFSITEHLDEVVVNGSSRHENPEPNGSKSESRKKEKAPKSIKKWVCGKLVEVAAEE